jgi:L-aspartate semialdehyde sulfurtransferase ferredoxin
MAKKKFQLSFSPDLVNEPITYRMVKDYDLQINILRAEVNDVGGKMLIEMQGKPEMIKKAVEYLKQSKVEVRELKAYVKKDEGRCTHCGMCISICPVEAMCMDPVTRMVSYLPEKCIACGTCIDACPPAAIAFKI